MKRFIKQNLFILIIALFSFVSSAFLIGDYNISNSNKALANTSFHTIDKEVSTEKEEFESSDFNIFRNLSETLDELFSLGF